MATEIPYTIGDYFGIVRRRWIFVATVLPLAVLIAVYVAYTTTPMYASSGTILLEPSSIPADMVRTTVTAYADQHIELVQRQVMATDRLLSLVEAIDPYPNYPEVSNFDKAALVASNVKLERVDPITMEPLLQSNAFVMHYYNPDPDLALAVAEQLVDRFLSYNRETRTQRAADNYDFLLAQSEEVGATVVELDKRVAEFKTKYGDSLPEAQGRNLAAIDRLQQDLDAREREMRLAQERINILEIQLTAIPPRLFEPDGNWRTELAQMRAELAEARQKYSEDHPTIRRLERSIAAMGAREATSPSSTARPDNPEYIQVASQLQTARTELAALRAAVERARSQIKDYERNAAMAPEVEREYSQLTRNYELAQERYSEIQTTLSQAKAAETLESEALGERFTLVRRPYRPGAPDSPNRLGIILLGFVLGGALSVGSAALRESSDPTVRSIRDLYELTDVKPIGAIPFMLNATDRRRRIVAWATASLVFAALVVFVGSTVAQAALGG
jgi:protein tyrosine kinase modulator